MPISKLHGVTVMFVARGPQTIFHHVDLKYLTWFSSELWPIEQLGDSLCPMHDQKLVRDWQLMSTVKPYLELHWWRLTGILHIPEGEVFTQRAARWSRCWRSIFHFYRKWIWHRTGLEIRNWNAFHALPEAASSSASLTGPTNFHGCPHGLAMASSYEELLTKSCTVKFGFPHLWMVFPRRCNLPRWTRTSSSAERFPMPPSTHVIWRNSVRYSSTHCLLMSIRPFLSVSSTHSNYSSPIVLSSP